MKFAEVYKQLIENDDDKHREAQKKTGFWGNRAAGVLFICPNTKRCLLQLRSATVDQPNTWGIIGGAIDEGESPEDGARREAEEEGNINGNYQLIPAYIFKHQSGFKYYNFIGVCEKEFTPNKSTEASRYKWFQFNKLPSNLHFGVKSLLNDQKTAMIIKMKLH